MELQEFLGRRNIAFDMIPHLPTYSAQRLAHEVHVSGNEVAKTVLLRTSSAGEYVVAVLPANDVIDFGKAASVLKCDHVELATEEEITERCTDCEVGALPPFGSQYNMNTLVDDALADEEKIVFEGTKHNEAICMRFDDFVKLERPLRGSFVLP